MRIVGIGLAVLLVACADDPPCNKDKFWVEAHADTLYVPVMSVSGDTVMATIITSWTDGCAPKGILEP